MPYETFFYLEESMKKEPRNERYHCGYGNRVSYIRSSLNNLLRELKVKVMT